MGVLHVERVGAIARRFVPTAPTVTGLTACFDANTLTGNDGDAITTWAGSEATTRDATQATAANRPVLKLAIQNGLNVVRFDGSDDYLKTPNGSLPQPATWFVVGRWRGAFVAETEMSDGASISNLLSRRNATDVGMYGGAAVLQTAVDATAWHVYTCVFNGASSSFKVDGGTAVTGSAGTAPANGVTIGAHGGNAGFGDVDIAEIRVYTAAVSSSDQDAIRAYLKSKWVTP